MRRSGSISRKKKKDRGREDKPGKAEKSGKGGKAGKGNKFAVDTAPHSADADVPPIEPDEDENINLDEDDGWD